MENAGGRRRRERKCWTKSEAAAGRTGRSPPVVFISCSFDKSPHATIQFLDFATNKTIPIWTLEKEPGWGLSLAPDGKSIVYVQNEFAESNLILVKNFR